MYEEERNGNEDERIGKKTVGINFMKGGGYEMGIIIVDERSMISNIRVL